MSATKSKTGVIVSEPKYVKQMPFNVSAHMCTHTDPSATKQFLEEGLGCIILVLKVQSPPGLS